MPQRDALLAEFDQEMPATRRVLAAVPEHRAGFRPHPKSFTIGELSLHVVGVLDWLSCILDRPGHDIAGPGGGMPVRTFVSSAALLAAFDEGQAAARGSLAIASDRDLDTAWTLRAGGEWLFWRPRAQCVRSFAFNHLYHHRGQLTVYLRLCDVPVPEVYGPTADSQPQ